MARVKPQRGVRGNGLEPRQRADGRWEARLDLGVVNGKRARKSFYGKTRKEVQGKLNRARSEQERGLPVVNERRTVAQFLTSEWLPMKQGRVRSSTYRCYETDVRVHLVPGIGHHALAKLQPQHVEALVRAKSEGGLAPLSVRNMLVTLRQALKQAEAWGLVARNVASLVKPPRVEHREHAALATEQALALLAAARDDRLEALYILALTLGLRQGEALGLRWSDVDLGSGILSVRLAMQRVGKVGDGGGLRHVETKSATSRRTIALPVSVVVALGAHRDRQHIERDVAGQRWQENGLIFCTTIGTPLDGPNVTKYFQKLLGRAGLPKMRYHDLRHSCASFMAAQGIPPSTAQEILGHSDIRLTLGVYTHALDEGKRKAAMAMDLLLHTPSADAAQFPVVT